METTEIKRYNAEHFGDFEMVESNQGDWVRWEDVDKLLESKMKFIRACLDIVPNRILDKIYVFARPYDPPPP